MAIHFVGFKNDRYLNALRVWRPDFIHRFYDARCIAEIMPGDTVIFADGEPTRMIEYTYDDSAYF